MKSLPLLLLLTVRLTFSSNVHAAEDAHVRVNQVGYRTDAPKVAYLMSPTAIGDSSFTLVNSSAVPVHQGPVGASAKWSNRFRYVYRLDFSSVQTPDTYTLVVGGITSESFRIDSAGSLYSPLLANARKFYEAQRDGADVNNAVLNRQPSHLNDATASVYTSPKYVDVDGVPTLKRDLKQVGGPVDVAGGWFDAGDYLKFVQTTSFTTGLMLFAVRESPTAAANFSTEARVGIDWLNKMWDEDTLTLYYQVGIGDGNGDSILGDHDLWRLPQFDDGIDLDSKPELKYVKNRPALRAGPAGARISPNLAGRLAAAFALCYQVYRVSDPPYAVDCLRTAEQIYDLAKTEKVNRLLTVAPYDFYPETEWRDDMEWGAVELYNALAAAPPPNDLPHSDPLFYLTRAAQWAKKYDARFDGDDFDTLNLYDVGGLAHYELYRALGAAGHADDLAVSRSDLLSDLERRIAAGTDRALHTPFGLGKAYDSGDVVPHTFGLYLMTSWYQELNGSNPALAAFEQQQLNWVLGANPWGSSFVIGAGTHFPNCPQHQVANLAGALDGTGPILTGGVVNGPSDKSEFQDLGLPEDPTVPRTCPSNGVDTYKIFTGKGVRYMDNVVAWMSVEPTLDYTVLAVLAFARQIEE